MSHMNPDFPVIRSMLATDLPAVMAIQAVCYGADYLEPEHAFANKLQQGDCCWVAEWGGQAQAYLVSLPTRDDTLPALHAADWQSPADPNLLYLHDMAVGPALRGMGVAPRLLDAARQRALQRGLRRLALVAVQGSVPYWTRHGFEVEAEPTDRVRAKLATFGADAHYMSQPLGLDAHQVT